MAERIDFTERAKAPLQIGLDHYPDEIALKESLGLLVELGDSLTVREMLAVAELAHAEGDRERARELYEDAQRYCVDHQAVKDHPEIRDRIEDGLRSLDNE